MEKGQILDNRYKVLKKIGCGSFSEVFKICDKKTQTSYALKTFAKPSSQFTIEQEAYSTFSNLEGIPKLLSSGSTDSSQYLILQLLSKSVQELNKKSRLSFKSTIEISLQLLSRLEGIHNLNFIHRDLKPSNLMVSEKKFSEESLVYLIDFGLCKKYRDPVSKVHLKYRENMGLVGNLLFCSVNVHRYIEQSRRDDIESWFYVMVYLMKETLPWDYESKQGWNDSIYKKKIEISYSVLCDGLPVQFVEIFAYIRNLRFDEKPNYEYLREALQKGGYGMVLAVDWVQKIGLGGLLKIGKKRERRSISQVNDSDLVEKVGKEAKSMEREEKDCNVGFRGEERKITEKSEFPEFRDKRVSFRVEITHCS